MTNQRLAIGDDELVDDWSIADLKARIEQGGTSDVSIVLRVLSARLAAQAESVNDPLSVLSDLAYTLESVHSTFRRVLDGYERLDEPAAADGLDHLVAAIGELSHVAQNF